MAVGAVHQAKRGLRRAGDSDWLERAARVGFLSRGLLYLTVAFLAAGIAIGRNDETADKQGAVRALADAPVGTLLLVVLAVGFAGLALWQAAEAIWGRQDESNDAKRAGKRAAAAGRAVVYALFAGSAALILLSGKDATGGGNAEEATWTARVFELPGGRVLVGLAGVGVVALGVWLAVRGARSTFEKHLDTSSMPQGLRQVVRVGGILGHVARGVVVGLAGLLLGKAALDYDPQQAKGVDGTLRTIAEQPYGKLLLLIAAAGLAAFGLYSVVESRYRRL